MIFEMFIAESAYSWPPITRYQGKAISFLIKARLFDANRAYFA
jgi:hypothetical protein